MAVLMLLLFVSCTPRPNEKGEYVVSPGKNADEIHIKFNDDGTLGYISQYRDGKPEGLYLNFLKNRNPDNMTFLKEGKNYGTGLVFHKNGLLNNFGQYVDGEKSGWFYVFDRNSILTGKREYVLVNGNSYLNQWIEYDQNSVPDRLNSSYLSLKAVKDTIKNGEEYLLNVSLEASFFRQYMLLIVGPFDEKFNLPPGAACDTIKSTNYAALYRTSAYKNGLNTVRGMVQEIKLKDNNSAYDVRKIYFAKDFLVHK